MKRNMMLLAVMLLLCLVPFASLAEKYPDGAIDIVVSAKAGGDTDAYARILAEYMKDELGVPLNVNNKNSAIEGTREVYNAEPDGYVVEFFHASSLLTQICGKTDIGGLDQTICTVPVVDATSTLVIPAKKFSGIEDFVARAQAGEEIIASVNQGSYAHLACLLFEKAIGAKFKYVDSQNASERITDMLAGRIDIFFSQYGSINQYIESGDFLSLGVMSEERNSFFPDVPTFKEQGYDITMDKIFYFAFPPETDEEIVKIFADACEKAIANEECRKAFAVYYVEPSYHTPEESLKLLQDAYEDYKQFEDVLKGN